jgi:hypothetical protein
MGAKSREWPMPMQGREVPTSGLSQCPLRLAYPGCTYSVGKQPRRGVDAGDDAMQQQYYAAKGDNSQGGWVLSRDLFARGGRSAAILVVVA